MMPRCMLPLPLLLLLAIAGHVAVMTSGLHDVVMGQQTDPMVSAHDASTTGAGNWLTGTAAMADQCPAMTATTPQVPRSACAPSLVGTGAPAAISPTFGVCEPLAETRIRGSPGKDR